MTAQTAETLLQGRGARITEARVRVLALLLESDRALSHPEIEKRLAKLDRVTLYRVLDWLVGSGLAQRTVGGDRVWRFMTAGSAHARHAHFQCGDCGAVTCLENNPVPRLQVPRGYRGESVDVTVHGTCGACAALN